MKKTEVLTPEVMEEIPLEKQIDRTLVKHNVTNAVIAKLKKDFGGLKLNDVNDKENYLIICDAKKSVRKVGIITEKICKEGRSDAIKIQKMWLAKEAEILGKIAEVQDPLDAEIKKFEDEEKRLEQVEQERKDNQYNTRQTELIKMGATLANGCLNINDLSIETSNIREVDDEDYNETILPLFKLQYEKNEAARVAEENKKRLEREEFEKQQLKLKEQQEEMKKRQEQLELQKKEFQEKIKEAERIRQEEESKVVMKKFNERFDMLTGYSFNGSVVKNNLGQALGNVEYVVGLSDEVFNEMVSMNNKAIEDRKKQQEENRQLELQRAQEEAAQKERERIEEEQRQAKIKAEQEEQARIEDAAKATDKEKWATFVTALNEFYIANLPEFKSKGYKDKRAIAKEKFEEISEL